MITPEGGRPTKPVVPRQRDFAPYLAKAGEVLASSLDYGATLKSLGHLVVPDLADWCVIDVAEEGGTIARLAVAHENPEKVAWANDLRRRYPPDPDAPRGVPQVLRSGKAEFYPEVTGETLAAAARDPEHLRLLREVGFTSAMIVPLTARGHTLGAITLVLAESERRYEPGDLALAEDLARRAALAVDNARLYREAQREIAERGRAEEALREREARFRAVYESSPIGIANVDVDGRFVQTNRAFREMLGYTAEELGSMTFENVTNPEDVAESREVLARLARGEIGESSFEKRYYRKDGRQIWCRLTVSAVRDASGRFLYTVTMDEDITERKRADQEL
ncbi:MAG TPA: PAS domain S-box protein, partial [Rubrobacteraceae bacterium]|nr:PAS domain S-box protein [Rubrobacteraceae bacterium]